MFTPLETALSGFADIELTDDPDFFSTVVAKKLEELYEVFNNSQYHELPISPYLNFVKDAIFSEQRFCYRLNMISEASERAGLLKLIKNNIAEKKAHINMALITVEHRIPMAVRISAN